MAKRQDVEEKLKTRSCCASHTFRELTTKLTCLNQVISTIYAVSSVASSSKGYGGPCIGTKIAEKNARDFDEATLNAGKFVLGGQMGYTEGESQSGMSMGKTRKVVDL